MNPFLESTVAQPWSEHDVFSARHRMRQGIAMLGLSASLQAAWALDINTASVDELQALKGIGQKTAAVIVAERQRGGAFLSFDDVVDRVNGVGAKRLRAWQQAGLGLPVEHGGSRNADPAPGRVRIHINMPASGRGKAAR